MPEEVGYGLLDAEQVVHSVDDDVDRGGVACLSTQVVLEGQVVSFTEQLEEPEERDGEGEVREDLTHGCQCG